MTREMKFRGWDNTFKIMLVIHGWDENVNDRYTIMQYTGIKDRNGKEIYEGDIVKSFGLYNAGIVTFGRFTEKNLNCEGRYVDYQKYIGGYKGKKEYSREKESLLHRKWKSNETCNIIEHDDVLEVVGNIYENIDLLQNWK